jgi:hypothetical protein
MTKEQKDTIIKQILSIRDTEKTNMFDKSTVQRLALNAGYYELVSFIEENPKEYAHIIMTGGWKDEES